MATPGISNIFPGAILHPTPYFGYPTVSAQRRVSPTILAVVHTTETYSVPYPSSTKSWTFSVERDGTVHQFMDPVTAAPWTNGDAQSSDATNPLIVAAANSGYNFNEFCFLTIENVNRVASGQRLTDAQLAKNHEIIAWGAALSGLPMNRRHIIGHYQVNGLTRTNCPTPPDDRNRVFDGIINVLPDTAMSKEPSMQWRPVIEQWRTHTGNPDGKFYTDGPGVGDPKYFITAEKVTSFAESADNKWRQLAYGSEVLFMERSNLDVISGSRHPATGYGLPPLDDGTAAALQAKIAAAQPILSAAGKRIEAAQEALQ